jgi:hypothetical protein
MSVETGMWWQGERFRRAGHESQHPIETYTGCHGDHGTDVP